jgi:hypothetical protein
MYWFLSFVKWFLVTPDSAPPGPGPSHLKETVLRLGKRFSNHKFIRIEQSFISTPPAGMFNWHQFRLSGLYGLQLLEVPTLTSLTLQIHIVWVWNFGGLPIASSTHINIASLCDPAWIDIHGFWCTVLLHEWCDQEGSPLPQRQTNKNILSSAWKYNILTASFVIPLTSTYMTLSTKWVHYWMILEGRLTGYFDGRQARPMRILLLDICTALIEGSCFMSSCHTATWSRAA